mgnify:FL=1|jgi:hypothetical protein
MAIQSAVCNSFKTEVLRAIHNFTQGGNTFRLALYTSSATLNKSTTVYVTANEVANGNGYTTKGAALTNVTPALSGDTACCDFSDVSFTSASFTANGCLIFNDTATNDPAVCAIAFGGDKTVSSGTFTIQFPAADANNAILRIA